MKIAKIRMFAGLLTAFVCSHVLAKKVLIRTPKPYDTILVGDGLGFSNFANYGSLSWLILS